jgi:hypothetical protein
MKNLGHTIDRLIKVDPTLEERLMALKNKWRRWPTKTMTYWQELVDFLNSEPLMGHPARDKMREIVVAKRKPPRQQLSSFDLVTPNDKIVGMIPENVADTIRRNDRQAIAVAKLHVEANMTRNVELAAEVARKELIIELNTKKIWLTLKDQFKLWLKPMAYSIKKKDNMLVLVEQNMPAHQSGPAGQAQFIGPGIVKMDQNTLRQFLGFLGLEPPSSMFSDDGQ